MGWYPAPESDEEREERLRPAAVPVDKAVPGTDKTFFTTLQLTEGDQQLIRLIETALGTEHKAFDDLVELIMLARLPKGHFSMLRGTCTITGPKDDVLHISACLGDVDG